MLKTFLDIVVPTVGAFGAMFFALVKMPFRIRRENHDKLLNLLESVEKPQSAPIRLLRFRDYIGNSSASLTALQLLLALPDSVAALERYRFTGGRQQILRATSAGFVLRPSANNLADSGHVYSPKIKSARASYRVWPPRQAFRAHLSKLHTEETLVIR